MTSSSHINTLFPIVSQCISSKRIEAYRESGDSDLDTLTKSVWNICLCEAIYPVLQNLEIGLRNTIHASAEKSFRNPLWFTANPPIVGVEERTKVAQAERKLRRRMKPIEPGRMVAELNFGFWTSLFDVRYDRVLLNRPNFLKEAFPYMVKASRTRGTLSRRLNGIRALRNRVFHHERILNRNLAQDYAEIIETMDWINPMLREITQTIDRFTTVNSPVFYNQLKGLLDR